jgi:homoserine kinase type II
VTQSVYLLGDIYVLKIFETKSRDEIDREVALLELIRPLKIAHIVDRFMIDGRDALLYEQLDGKSLSTPTIDEVSQIATFLREFHNYTKNISSDNEMLYTKERLSSMIYTTGYTPLIKQLQSVEIELNRDGIIHGDLFVDNAKFLDAKLSGVYDFCDACVGDFVFELAVVTISWCYSGDELNIDMVKRVLQEYNSPLSYKEFKPYIHYALLYYATTRYMANRDYGELIRRLDLVIV